MAANLKNIRRTKRGIIHTKPAACVIDDHSLAIGGKPLRRYFKTEEAGKRYAARRFAALKAEGKSTVDVLYTWYDAMPHPMNEDDCK